MRSRLAAERALEVVEPTGDDARLAAALTELARAYSNLATVGIVADADERAETYAARALAMAKRLHRTDIEATAWCYLGGARLSRGDARGQADLDRSISVAASDSRVETKVRCIVNAAHGAYRSGRLDDAERPSRRGCRPAPTGTSSRASTGCALPWRRCTPAAATGIDRSPTYATCCRCPGNPGSWPSSCAACSRVPRPQGGAGCRRRSVGGGSGRGGRLGRQLRPGSRCSGEMELGWLDGSLGTITDDLHRALDLAAATGHRSVQAQLCAYLRRADIDVTVPDDAPGPWTPTLSGLGRGGGGVGSPRRALRGSGRFATAPDTRASAVAVSSSGDWSLGHPHGSLEDDLFAEGTTRAVSPDLTPPDR